MHTNLAFSIHITLLYAGLAGFMLVALSFNVMYQWVRVTGTGQETDQAMRRAERLVAHFVEYVPLTLILMGLLETNGVGETPLHLLGAGLLTARLFHALGSAKMRGSGLLRFLGAQTSFLIMLIESLLAVYLFLFEKL